MVITLYKTLYKLNKNSRLQQWTIEVSENRYRTLEGLFQGKISTSEWTICSEKNSGRANSVTPEEQALREANSKITKKREQGYYDSIEDAGNGKSFEEPMLAEKYQDKIKVNKVQVSRGEVMMGKKSVYSQPKFDGIRSEVSEEQQISRRGKIQISTPHILKEAKAIIQKMVEDGIPIKFLDGELYNHKFKHDFNKISSLVKKQKPTEEDLKQSEKLVRLYVYDIAAPGIKFKRRYRIYRKYLESCKYIIPVKSKRVHNLEELDAEYGKLLLRGYEGQMLRDGDSLYEHCRTTSLLKRKEFVDEEATILYVVEGKGNSTGLAASAHCKFKDGTEFDANIMGSKESRADLLNNAHKLTGLLGTIRYQNRTPDNKPRFPRLHSIRDYE